MQRGAIILCGGRSARMGRDKAMLPFGDREVMLQRVERLVNQAVPADRIVCVAKQGQKLPQLPASVQVVFDPIRHRGPLAGLATGIATLEQCADAAFVAGCDAPLLMPAFVERIFDLLADHEMAVPHDGQRWHPLAGVYRCDIRSRIDALLAAGERSLTALVDSSQTRSVATEDLRDIDPQLISLTTCNTPGEYQNALRAAGLTMVE